MRLQLTVQRHSLPPVQLLWIAGVLRAPYAAAGASCTISQFLEQVNDVIPLESDDWGLEDYAVEVKGFECLHFAELEQVLREDDEVCIRPLQTLDLRFRKVSGRHQISADGKHLIDGVAFGRPFLRRANRPAIRIPPRKRRRITYDEEDEDAGEEANDRQLMLRADLDDVDAIDEDSDDRDDEDFLADDEEDLVEELQDLQNGQQHTTYEDSDDAERTPNLDGAEEKSRNNTRARLRRKTGLGLQSTALIELLDDSGRPYPGEYSNPLLDLFDQDEPIHETIDDRLVKGRKGRRLRDAVRKENKATNSSSTNSQTGSGQVSSNSTKAVRFEDADAMTPATVRLDDGNEFSNAQGLQTQNSAGFMDESDKENAEPRGGESDSDESPFFESETGSAMSTSSESNSEDTSSSELSTSSGSDSDDENLPSPSRRKPIGSPSSSTTSSSSSDSDSVSSEPRPEKLPSNTVVRDPEDGVSFTGSESKVKAPGSRNNQTQKRNQRRRNSKRRAHLVKIGILPPNATLADFARVDADHKRVVRQTQEEVVEEPAPESTTDAAAIQARRKALLASINAGGVDVSVDKAREDEAPAATERAVGDHPLDRPTDDIPMADAQAEVENSQQSHTDDVPLGNIVTPGESTGISDTGAVLEESVSPNSSKRRAKLDLASSRRLLFGSLGLRAPKTKEDESGLREKMMKDVRPTKDTQSSEEFVADSVVEDGSWKDKVILQAVECCHEGVELSTPPFPFVQRWDPQQQTGYGGRGERGKANSKKRKRKPKQYYEDWEDQGAQYDASQQQAPVDFEDEQKINERAVRSVLDRQSPNALDNDVNEDAVNLQSMRESEEISTNMPIEVEETQDLPDLPEDMSLCPDLRQENCILDTVVAFKQLDMSAETNWQPRVSEYKTAIINQLMDDGILRMTLAKRDQPTRGEVYDDETGERVYGKFEMPGYEDDDNGIVELSFADLIHPKLVQAVDAQRDINQLQQSGPQEACPKYDAEIVMAEATEALHPSLNGFTASKPGEPTLNPKAEKVNAKIRKEIRELITDAGWRSSVGSCVLEQALLPEPNPSGSAVQSAENYHDDDDTTKVSSPRFSGFGSSPPPNRSLSSKHELQPDSIGIETDESILPQTVAETVAATSPRFGPLVSDKVEEDRSLKDDDVDKDVIWDDVPSRLLSAEGNHQSIPQQFSSLRSSPKTASQSLRPRGGLSQRKTSAEANLSLDGADSDNEFPTLENVLASTRSSFESLVPEDEDYTFVAKSSFETVPSADEDQKRQRRPKSAAKRNIREQSKTLPEFQTFKEEDEEFAPRLSQVPLGSQIVDLTLSSDLVYSPGSDDADDSCTMPSGPGWVRKTRANSKQLSTPTGESLRSRTRSSV